MGSIHGVLGSESAESGPSEGWGQQEYDNTSTVRFISTERGGGTWLVASQAGAPMPSGIKAGASECGDMRHAMPRPLVVEVEARRGQGAAAYAKQGWPEEAAAASGLVPVCTVKCRRETKQKCSVGARPLRLVLSWGTELCGQRRVGEVRLRCRSRLKRRWCLQ